MVTLVRRGLQHQELSDANILNTGDHTTDVVSVRVLSKKLITLHNISVPPIKNSIDDNRAQNFDPNSIPVTLETVVCADFNAHSSSWDPKRAVNNVGR